MMIIYKGVSLYEFEGLLNAPSVGSYLHRNKKIIIRMKELNSSYWIEKDIVKVKRSNR